MQSAEAILTDITLQFVFARFGARMSLIGSFATMKSSSWNFSLTREVPSDAL